MHPFFSYLANLDSSAMKIAVNTGESPLSVFTLIEQK